MDNYILRKIVIIFDIISILIYAVSPTCNKVKLFHGEVTLFTDPYSMLEYKCDDGFELFGADFSFCLEGVWNPPIPICHATGCDSTEYSAVENGEVSIISQNSLLTVNCNPGYIMDGESIISCDGTHWSEPVPHCYPAVDINHCDFEYKSLCGWTQDKNHQSDWIIKSGETATKRTGPRRDHTLGIGHYIYMESSTPNRKGHTSRLLSPIYPWYKSRRCFRLWYHMLGPTEPGYMGDLEILIRYQSGESDTGYQYTEHQLFVVSGNQGEEWHEAKVFIEKQSKSFQIVVQATRGVSHTADIAVDDFQFFHCTNDTDLEKAYFDSTTSAINIVENYTPKDYSYEITTTSGNDSDTTVLDKEEDKPTSPYPMEMLDSNSLENIARKTNGPYKSPLSTVTLTPIASLSISTTTTTDDFVHFDDVTPKHSELSEKRKETTVLKENIAVFPDEVVKESAHILNESDNNISTISNSNISNQIGHEEGTNEPQGFKFSIVFKKPEYLAAIAGVCLIITLSVVIISVLIFKRRKIWGRKKSDDQLTVLYTKKPDTYSAI